MDEGEPVEAQGPAADRLVTLQYDFLKQLTSLSLLAIGGAVTFAGSIFQHVADKRTLWLATAGFAIAGMCGFLGQLQLLRQLDPDRRDVRGWRRWVLGYPEVAPSKFISIATVFVGMSVGGLIAFAMDNLR